MNRSKRWNISTGNVVEPSVGRPVVQRRRHRMFQRQFGLLQAALDSNAWCLPIWRYRTRIYPFSSEIIRQERANDNADLVRRWCSQVASGHVCISAWAMTHTNDLPLFHRLKHWLNTSHLMYLRAKPRTVFIVFLARITNYITKVRGTRSGSLGFRVGDECDLIFAGIYIEQQRWTRFPPNPVL